MALVGIRSTMGLTSRDGIVPLYQRNDVGGPMARTVEDAARTLNVTAGDDPADPITARSEGRVPVSYLDSLDPDGLEGARIGVNRWFLGPDSTHPDIVSLMEEAVAELREAGAEIVDPFDIEGLEGIDSTWCDGFKSDLEAYFATRGPDFPYKTLDDILATGKYAVYIEESLRSAAASTEDMCLDVYNCPRNIEFRERVLAAMDANELDAFVYPTWSYPARLIDDLNSPAGDNSQFVAPRTGLPAIQIPIGFTREGLPAGMTFIGRLFDESTLIRLTYSYEQATHKRKTPKGFE
jgi:Asp-tRNA(Asn)/Glu-tRNA(Gln) amidotransferase A subunit family amidase